MTEFRTTIRPPGRWTSLDLPEMWRFRDLLGQFALRDLKLRYKQTALGVVWVVLQPLMAAGVFTFVFGTVAKLSSEGVPYFLFSYMSMIAWNSFASVLGKVSSSLTANAALISKVFFPRLLLPLAVLGSTLVDTVVSLGMGAVLMAFEDVGPTWRLVTAPLWLALALALAIGSGLIAASLMVQYRDVGYVLPVVTQLLLFLTPIAYSLQSVPSSRRGLVDLDPLTGIVIGFRWSILSTRPPSATSLIASLVATVLVVGAGVITFNRLERRFADAI